MLLKEDLINAYRKLYKLLDDLNSSLIKSGEDVIERIVFFSQFNKLSIKFYDSAKKYREGVSIYQQKSSDDLHQQKMLSVLASICTPMQNKEGFEWIKDQEKITEYEEIRDEINDLGFNIKFKGTNSFNYQLIIYEQ
jgi:hypothetical protein